MSVRFVEKLSLSGIRASIGSVGDAYDKGLASWCTSWRGLGGNSISEGAALSGGEAGVFGGWWLVEPLVFVVCFVGVEDSRAGPAFDGAGVHAQPSSDLGVGEQAFGAESVGVAGQVVAAACFEHDAGSEGFAFSGVVTGGVERLGGLGVGVGVKELIERCEGVGVGLAERQAFGGIATTRLVVCPPRKRTCRWMRSVLCR